MGAEGPSGGEKYNHIKLKMSKFIQTFKMYPFKNPYKKNEYLMSDTAQSPSLWAIDMHTVDIVGGKRNAYSSLSFNLQLLQFLMQGSQLAVPLLQAEIGGNILTTREEQLGIWG